MKFSAEFYLKFRSGRRAGRFIPRAACFDLFAMQSGRRTGARRPVRLHAATSQEDKIMSDLYFGTDLFSEFDRLQQQMAQRFGGFRPAFARAVSARSLRSISVRQTIQSRSSRSRPASTPPRSMCRSTRAADHWRRTQIGTTRQRGERRTYAQERFAGTFRRVIELPRPPIPTRCRRTTKTGVYPSALASVNRPGRVPSLSSKRRSRS